MYNLNTTMALTFYYADCKKTFEKWKYKRLEKLSKEISKISEIAPIYEPSHNFKKGFFKNICKSFNLRLISPQDDNTFSIRGVEKKFTTLHLMSLLTYCADRLSGGQIEERFEYSKIGGLLADGKNK